MAEKLEITIDVIAHATEDVNKILVPFLEIFKLEEDDFTTTNLTGHFDNPITLLRAKVSKKKAKTFLEKFKENLPEWQLKELVDNIEERIFESTLHLRLGKQELVTGSLVLQDKDAIKVKIFVPSYNKKNIVKNYSALFDSIN